MKKIVVVVAVLVAAYIGLTDWIGARVEKRFPEFIQQMAAIGQMNVTIDSYERSLFRSTARTTISLQSYDGQDNQVTLEHSIWHGPLPFGQDSSGSWHLRPSAAVVDSRLPDDAPGTGVFAEILGMLPELRKLHEITTIGFSGNGQVSITLPPFTRDYVEDNIKTSVEWTGLSGTEFFDATMSNLHGQFESTGLTITRPDAIINIGQIDSTFRLNMAQNGLLLGQIDLNAAEITAGARGMDPGFVLKGFRFSNTTSQEDDTIGYSVEMVADSLLADKRQIGPVGYELNFVRLDTATIVEVQRQLQALQLGEAAAAPEQLGDKILSIYAAALPELLKKSPEIQLSYLRLQSPDGDLWGKGKVVFDGSNGTPVTDFDSFIEIIDGDSEFQIAGSLLRSIIREFIAPQFAMMRESGQMGEIDDATFNASLDQAIAGQVANLVAQGILVEDNSNYRLQFAYKNRQALLNGKPMPL